MPVIQSLIAIGVGATLGAWGRWALGLWLNPLNDTLSVGTLAANLIGGFAIGMAVEWFATQSELSPAWRLFVITGLLGGLTTFSTFSAEVVHLLGRHQYGWAILTTGLHVVGSTTMTVLGIMTVRSLRAGWG